MEIKSQGVSVLDRMPADSLLCSSTLVNGETEALKGKIPVIEIKK